MLKKIVLFLCFTASQPVLIAQQNNLGKLTRKQLFNLIEQNPNNMNAHLALVKTFSLEDSALLKQYQLLERKFPSSYAIPYMEAKLLGNNATADILLERAVTINPKMSLAWRLRWYNAEQRGDFDLARVFSEKTIELEKDNAEYAFYYAESFARFDRSKSDSLFLRVVRRFPNDVFSARSLFYLAQHAETDELKETYYELLYTSFVKNQNDWSFIHGMDAYYNFLFVRDLSKAYGLALKMYLNVHLNRHVWYKKLVIAREVLLVKSLIKNKKPEEAENVLNSIKLVNKNDIAYVATDDLLVILRSQIDDLNGKTKEAYEKLTILYARRPSKDLRAMIFYYSEKLRIMKKDVVEKICLLRNDSAKIATTFSLKSFYDSTAISLDQYRGKVVLLTYWFPACSPCHTQFNHIESVMRGLKSDDVINLGINIVQQQDKLVIPYINKYKYSFIPLYDDPRWKKGTLPAPGAPTTYIIDKEGRIIFSDVRIDENNEDMLECMLNELAGYDFSWLKDN